MNDASEVHQSAENLHWAPFESEADDQKLALNVVLLVLAAMVAAACGECH